MGYSGYLILGASRSPFIWGCGRYAAGLASLLGPSFFSLRSKNSVWPSATRSAALSHFGPRAKAALPPQLAAFIWAQGPFSARSGQLFWPSDVKGGGEAADQGRQAAGPSRPASPETTTRSLGRSSTTEGSNRRKAKPQRRPQKISEP
ncbi:hypothetical protein SapgrDRAFT_1416 [Saprospira grandis DSM 2844]|uniref:Uncharacterized protein n=1 Tax=Saprospira grandis DSM 2844 TaxID=694433 RepID=J0P6N0_9BACT|nr:hypothetical protein SapgrDRAFT_1416 [Saprospira grandis DSM 2844]